MGGPWYTDRDELGCVQCCAGDHGGTDGRSVCLLAEGGISVDDVDLEDGPRVRLRIRAAVLGGGVTPRDSRPCLEMFPGMASGVGSVSRASGGQSAGTRWLPRVPRTAHLQTRNQ